MSEIKVDVVNGKNSRSSPKKSEVFIAAEDDMEDEEEEMSTCDDEEEFKQCSNKWPTVYFDVISGTWKHTEMLSEQDARKALNRKRGEKC